MESWAASRTIADVSYEPLLATLFPGNNNIRPKLRQQLQQLRDLGQISFLGKGRYARLAT
ncbi:MAG: hypothetical protein E6H66_08620 [Betaproteobacteria bacterium]|nr:MAG: hypothetical protein E6H66_08620 [Betaproteobacteria bacterium]